MAVMVLCRVRINYRETIPLHAAHHSQDTGPGPNWLVIDDSI